MDANKGNIYQILNGFKQFIIPVYQRIYSWEESQCERLWRDIVKMQKDSKVGHFVGSIVNIAESAMPTGVQKFMIIDGQQRITTLSILLIALRNFAINNPDEKEINAPMIDSMLLKNDYQSGDDRYKLLLTQTDKDVLIKLIENAPLDSAEKSKIIKNYKFFSKKISEGEITPKEVYESIGKLQIVNITLDRQVDDPQAIFESLNSTGMDLSESDLIRNYVLMGLETGIQNSIYENVWYPMEQLFSYEKQSALMDRFFRDYLTLKIGRIPNVKLVYSEFKDYHMKSDFSNIKELCDDLYSFSKYYTDMYFCKSEDKDLQSVYSDVKALQMEVAFPFLLKVHQDQANGLITLDELIEIIKICISYVYRRSICEIPTNSLNKTFATLKNDINIDDYLVSIKAAFILKNSYREFPDNDKFIRAFMSRDIYNMRTRNFTLSRLENHNNKAPVNIENYTIEHIMPQNKNLSSEWITSLGDNYEDIQKKYIHTIGNLTLTAYNSEMSDKAFMEKMNIEGGFKQSALRINSFVVLQEDWNEDTLNDRSDLLAGKAIKIWDYPKLSEDELAPYKNNDTPKEKYSLSTYHHLNATNKLLLDKLHTRLINLSPAVKREFKKLYIAYKVDTNFIDIVVQKSRLRLSLNMKFSEIDDPIGLCLNITNLGRWGNGDIEVHYTSLEQLDDVMYLVVQSFNKQID